MKVHLIGIGGTGMTSLAGLLTQAGHTVTGSDEKLYPPTSDQIRELNISPFVGYSPDNIAEAKPDLVVIGNVIRRENPEATAALQKGLEYRSMPQAISELFLRDRTPIVIAGTHGKTTVSTLVAWLARSCGVDAGFMIGGVGLNFGKGYSLGKDSMFVLEGDEYDTAFFDKGPKFLHYRPQGLIITSIEFDHADIYRDVNHIIESFERLVKIVPPDGVIVANADDANVMRVISHATCRVVKYGSSSSADYIPSAVEASSEGTSFFLSKLGMRFSAPLWGVHNLMNAVAAIAMLVESGQPKELVSAGLQAFRGVKRRQEIFADVKGVTIVDDFAHHPTAVAKTIESMKFRFPNRRVWAIFEPRSNTSRRNIFQSEFTEALSSADKIIIAPPYRQDTIPENERLDAEAIATAITRSGKDAHSIADTENIVEYIMRGVDHGDVILVMSNGAFDGMCPKLVEALGKRRIVSDGETISPTRVPR